MMGGHADLNIDNAQASRVIAMDLISALGRRPNAKNYLSSIVPQIMNDGLFTDVRDRSNANFLWFITFERRMADAEKRAGENMHDDATINKNNIVSLPENRPVTDISDKNDSDMASVFFLDHFRAG
jgi:hypothetical protein